jgi:protein gp37
MSNSKIDWCDKTWNVTGGCSKVSAGCLNCWAEKLTANRFKNNPRYDGLTENGKWTGKIKLFEDRLDQPLHWRKPQRIFVASQSDLFHPDVPMKSKIAVTRIMLQAKQHTFLVLTKRPERMKFFFDEAKRFNKDFDLRKHRNIHLGVSASTQEEADKNILALLQIPAAVMWVSFEPLLGSLDIYDYLIPVHLPDGKLTDDIYNESYLDYVIIGCEHLGGGKAGRFQDGFIDAAIDIVKQCKEAGVPVFVKQIPINGKVVHDISKFPKDLRHREILKTG